MLITHIPRRPPPPAQFVTGVVIISTRLVTTRNALADIPKEYVPILQYHVSPVRLRAPHAPGLGPQRPEA